MKAHTLTQELLNSMNAYWRAAIQQISYRGATDSHNGNLGGFSWLSVAAPILE